MRITWTVLILASQLLFVYAAEEVWRDPNDPTREHRPRQAKVTAPALPAVQKFQPDQSLRLILRQLLNELEIDYQMVGPMKRDVQVKISRYSMSVLSKYLNDDDADFAQDRESVRSALSNIFTVKPVVPDTTWQDTFMFLQPFIFTLNLFILPAAGIVVIRSIVRPRNFWILVFSTILLVSMYSGYNRKYQEAESRRFAQFQESSRDACAPEGLLSRMVEIVASPFQYRQKSNCLKYIESQTISIFHEISIIEVFSETISSGFFAFLSASAKHLNHFFRDLYDGAPIIAQIVMTIFLVLMVGTIRTPLFSYEPIWLTFCSSSIGKIAGWLEGEAPPPPLPPATIQLTLNGKDHKKEVKRLEQAKAKKAEKAIEFPKSEKEEGSGNEKEGDTKKVEKRGDEETSILGESSEDEDDFEQRKDSVTDTDWNEAVDSASLSESSF